MEDLLVKITTKEDQEKILSELDTLASSLYINNGNGFQDVLRSQVRSWVSEYLESLSKNTIEEKSQTISDMKTRIQSMQTITLTIAFEPTFQTIERLSHYLKSVAGVHTLLRIIYDPTVIAGCRITTGSHYRDYSFSDQLNKSLQAI